VSRLRRSIHRACFGPLPGKPLRFPPRPELPSPDMCIRLPEASSELLRLARSCVNLVSPCLRHCAARERWPLHSPQLRARRRTNSQTVRALETMCTKGRRASTHAAGCPSPVTQPTRQKEMNMTTKIVLALALAMTALASVPASASPHHDWQVAGNCQEDLGYGRTSGWGCG